MAKNKKRTQRIHIKQKSFSDRNYSPLDALVRSKGQLDSPFRRLRGGVSTSSWYSDFLPNCLWACILSSLLDRKEYLGLFRETVVRAHDVDEATRPRVLTHNHLATTSAAVFDQIFKGVLSNSSARQYLRALRLIDCLPDVHHWARSLDAPDETSDWGVLVHAVADNFDHQGERATDVRWMKVIHEIVSGKIAVPKSMADLLEDFRRYPDRGEMIRVRPAIRSMEMTFRLFETGDEDIAQEPHPVPIMGEKFWQEMKSKSDCVLPKGFEPPKRPSDALRDEIMVVMQAVQHHFDSTLTTTNADPRHDGAFGLVLFAMSYLMSMAAFYGHDFAYSRIVLRALAESFITLEYLGTKDDPSIWEQYRRYGAGQAKLAFLKNLKDEELPDFVDLNVLENLANEDMWLELEDIRIGNWAKTDLRSMAQASDVKDVYDRYYDWTSGFAHGHWAAVRETAFVNCLNPLHRFHRIPGPPLAPLPSILPDAAKLVNRMLDRLNALYPTFKQRLTKHKAVSTPEQESPTTQLAE
jgi:hypothetical protein